MESGLLCITTSNSPCAYIPDLTEIAAPLSCIRLETSIYSRHIEIVYTAPTFLLRESISLPYSHPHPTNSLIPPNSHPDFFQMAFLDQPTSPSACEAETRKIADEHS
jgi:hypothetical protein